MNAPEPASNLGRVLLFTGGDPIATLVKWFTRSHYSHAAILIPGTNRVIESYPFKGVRERELTAKDWERIHVYEVPGMTGKMWDAACAFGQSQMGKPYDFRSVLKFVTRTPAKENGKWFCSELVFQMLAVSYLRILQKRAEYVDPGDLPASPFLRRDEAYELRMAQFYSEGEDA